MAWGETASLFLADEPLTAETFEEPPFTWTAMPELVVSHNRETGFGAMRWDTEFVSCAASSPSDPKLALYRFTDDYRSMAPSRGETGGWWLTTLSVHRYPNVSNRTILRPALDAPHARSARIHARKVDDAGRCQRCQASMPWRARRRVGGDGVYSTRTAGSRPASATRR
jgi:hypothetical protein